MTNLITKDIDAVKLTVCNFDNLYNAMLKCARGTMWKDSTAGFLKNGIRNCIKLENDGINGTYKISPYSKFVVYEPKKRNITSTRMPDRVFQRSLCDNYLTYEVSRHFIYDNGACMKGKGTDFARNRLKCHIEKYVRKYGAMGYFLKCDVKNFFGSAIHEIAKTEMSKYIRSEFARKCVNDIIDSFDGDVGVGLGGQPSQLIMTALLNHLDHKLKEDLKCKYYDRYMDDMVIIADNKEFLHKCLAVIKSELKRIGFILNQKKTNIVSMTQGLDFLGFKWKVSPTGKILKSVLKPKVVRERRKLKHQMRVLPVEKVKECVNCWIAHAKKATCKKYVVKKIKSYLRRIIKCSNLLQSNSKRSRLSEKPKLYAQKTPGLPLKSTSCL